ncbi:30S ribosomal protein S7 [Patescibacteria group bacterium]
MPRRGGVKPKKVQADPVYGSPLVTKLINRSMKDGKKSVAQKQIYAAFEIIEKKTKKDPLEVYNIALDNIRPAMEVRPRRVGGAAYQVPMPVRGSRKDTLAIRWLIFAARAKSNSEFHTYGEKLAAEIMDAANGEGGAVSKKQDVQRMAEANRAFAHFRW